MPPTPVPPLHRPFAAPSLTIRGREFVWGRRTYVMGIINVTPDSFSGDGLGGDVAGSVELARRFEDEGADLLDIGAESSRPGADELHPEDELARLLPHLGAIRAATQLPLSADTYHPEVAEAALAAGADMLNDIHGLRRHPAMAGVAAEHGVPVIAMHNQRGRPFSDVAGDISAGFEATLTAADRAGIDPTRIILDPGFGFGWTAEQNLEMLRRLPELWRFDVPLLVGASRKSTLGLVTGAPAGDRLEASLAAAVLAVAGGADIVRVHDVRQTVAAVRIADAIARGTWRAPREAGQ